MAKKTATNELKKILGAKRELAAPPDPKTFLSSGSTMLNLACSGYPFGAFMPGGYYWFIGDSSSGKTFNVLTCLAEAAKSKRYSKYRLIHDDVEGGALMDISRFFGDAVAERLEPPRGTREDPEYSETAEQFYDNVAALAKEGTPFIYVLDSMDALTTEASDERIEENAKKREAGKETGGSYGDGKAKVNSERLRKTCNLLRKTGSILIIISQTRDNLGFGAQFNPKVVSGGRSLLFYCQLAIWSSVKEKLKKTVRGKLRQIGIKSRIQVKKNRFQGRDRTIESTIYNTYGVDDIGACVDYLIEEKHWKVKSGEIAAPEFDFRGTRDELIAWVEENNAEKDLRSITGEVWAEIEAACAVQRKPRY